MTEDFWDWLPKAYGEVGDEPVFTKYNMEVAFAAGAEAEAKRMWVGLTDEEVIIMSRYDLEYAALIGEVQRTLKEKNT